MPYEAEMMTFARAKDDRVVHVDEVAKGLACECVCLKCGGKLVGRQGNVRQHHFSHYLATDGVGCTETALHLAAKSIIQRERRLALPLQLDGFGTNMNAEACFDSVSLEHPLGSRESGTDIRADAFGRGVIDMVIEIAVHHRVSPDKADKIRRLGLSAVEIDLANAVSSIWDWEALSHAVLNNPHRRHWINFPEPEPIKDSKPVIASIPPLCEFNIYGIPVVARKLPFRNVSIRHKYDPSVRQIVESACRGRGWWNAEYRNWVVFDYFWPEVFSRLQAKNQQRD